jgi:hypothetical protein
VAVPAVPLEASDDVAEEFVLSGGPLFEAARVVELRAEWFSGVLRLRSADSPPPAQAELLAEWLDDALAVLSDEGAFDSGVASIQAAFAPFSTGDDLAAYLGEPARLLGPQRSVPTLDPSSSFLVAVQSSLGPLCVSAGQAAFPSPEQADAADRLAADALLVCGLASVPVGFIARALGGDHLRAFVSGYGEALRTIADHLAAPPAAPRLAAALSEPGPAAFREDLTRILRKQRAELASYRVDDRRPPGGAPDEKTQEEIDDLVATLIWLRELLDEARKQIGERSLQHLVWRADPDDPDARVIDWNPWLSALFLHVQVMDGQITGAIQEAARASDAAPVRRTVTRMLHSLTLIGAMFGGIAAVQWALSEAEAPLVGEEAFHDDMLGPVEAAARALDKLRQVDDPESMKEEILETRDDIVDVIEFYAKLFQVELALFVTAAVVVGIALVILTAKALAVVAAAAVGAAPATVTAGGVVAAEAVVIGAGVAATVAATAVLAQKAGGIKSTNLGRLGEIRAGIRRGMKSERFPSMTRSGRIRIPDKPTAQTIEEVKNVLNLSLTRQLIDYIFYAGLTNRRFVLWVRAVRRAGKFKQVTKLSKPLQQMVDSGDIRIRLLKATRR